MQTAESLSQQNTCEQNANEILTSIITLLHNLPDTLSQNITCCGLCTQRSTVVAWHKTLGTALSPAISWQDTRTKIELKKLAPHAQRIRKISGLTLSAHYAAAKIHMLQQTSPKVKQAKKQVCISPLASYLLFNLLKEKPNIIDHTNAQRCQLFDTQTLNWSDELLTLFQVNREILPQCAPVIHHFGTLKFHNIPVTAVCGDQNAVIHAYPPLNLNDALINIGTGAFILSCINETHNTAPRLLQSISHSDAKKAHFISEGTINAAGAALTWAQNHDPCTSLFSQLPQWLNEIKNPPIFINSINGIGSPWWYDAGEAAFINKKTTQQAERYVAIIESIVFLIFKNIEQLSTLPKSLFISGGLSALEGLCQKLSDLSHIHVIQFTNSEASARGCAWLANQLNHKHNDNWKPLPISRQFRPNNQSKEQLSLQNRYRQFIGELNKRCNKD